MIKEEAKTVFLNRGYVEVEGGTIYDANKWREACHVISEWLEQEPKTVLYSGDGYADGYMVYDMAECPNCGRKFEYGDETWSCNFCPDCGQALNWESEG